VIRSNSGGERRINAVIATLTVLAIPAVLALCIWLLVTVAFDGEQTTDCDAPPRAAVPDGGRGEQARIPDPCITFESHGFD
jgi:hypothetical protein